MFKNRTQKEVYERIYTSIVAIKTGAYTGEMTAAKLDRISREANKHSIEHTWYWFNRQEEFEKNPLFRALGMAYVSSPISELKTGKLRDMQE